MQAPTGTDLTTLLPALILAIWGMGLLLVGLVMPLRMRSVAVAGLSVVGLGTALLTCAMLWDNPASGFDGAIILDNFGLFLSIVFILAGILTVLLSVHYLPDRQIDRFEYYPLLLLCISGMALMSSVNDLVMLFIALELLSIPLYILAGFARPEEKSEESALKYFLLGAFASAFLIYGIALVFGGTGTTAFPGIVEGAMGGDLALTLAGIGLILAGLAFKIAAVPFHMWTPDVYEGAPTPVTAFMSIGAKAAGFAALARILLLTLPSLDSNWVPLIAAMSALTIVLGNLVAIVQSNIKRMLAYSSIAHAGYMLMAVAANNNSAVAALLFYVFAYAITNLGAFAVVAMMADREGEDQSFAPYGGLAKRRPWVAAAMTLFMLSLTGIPPTVGFVGKYHIFVATIEADLVWLAGLGVLTSLVSAYFYLRVIVRMYFDDSAYDAPARLYPTLATAILLTAVGTLVLGLWPNPLLDLARSSIWPILG